MKQYLELLKDVKEKGRAKHDRTGTGTVALFGAQSRYDLTENKLPVITTKAVHLPSVIHELLWFISGNTNVKYLQDNDVKIWNEWADEWGNLGPIYGKQWRRCNNYKDTSWGRARDVEGNELVTKDVSIDQLQNAIDTILDDPYSRRIIVSSWNVADISDMKLPPCHLLFQFYVEDMTTSERAEWLQSHDLECFKTYYLEGDSSLDDLNVPRRWLSTQLYQRSADMFLGVPFNIASYGLLTHIVAKLTNTAPREFIHTIGDAHIYSNHFEQVDEQLSREVRPCPTIVFNEELTELSELSIDSFDVIDYDPHPKIKAKVAV